MNATPDNRYPGKPLNESGLAMFRGVLHLDSISVLLSHASAAWLPASLARPGEKVNDEKKPCKGQNYEREHQPQLSEEKMFYASSNAKDSANSQIQTHIANRRLPRIKGRTSAAITLHHVFQPLLYGET